MALFPSVRVRSWAGQLRWRVNFAIDGRSCSELDELPIQREPRSVALLIRCVDSHLTEPLQDSVLALRRDADPPSLLARADEVIE